MTTATIDPDPFATPEQFERGDSIITGGRYRLPNRDGSHKPYGWMRSTNLASAFSDQKQLQDWTVRTALAGLAVSPALVTELLTLIAEVGTDRDAVKAAQDRILDIAERAKDAAGGGYGRDRGNRVHTIVEADWAGIPVSLRGQERELLRLFSAALVEAQLKPIPGMQERIVLCEEMEVCGKFDSLAEDLVTNYVHVIDTKTQRKFWTWLEVEAQLAIYANAVAMWDADAKCWVDMPYQIERTRGAALWAPEPAEGEPMTVQVKPLDLERGWETVKIARRNVLQRSAAKSTKQAVSGRTWAEVRPLSTVERFARLLGAVESREEGSRVYLEAVQAGVWGPELEQVAARKLASL